MADLYPLVMMYVPRRLGIDPSRDSGFVDWILSGQYTVSSVGDDGRCILDVTNLDSFFPYLNYDYTRFALAAQESRITSRAEIDAFGFFGWPLLKLYYSGFFAAHAIMRSTVAGVVRVGSNETGYLNQIIQTLGLSTGIGNGMYSVTSLSRQGSGVEITLKPHNALGAHEGFWKEFCLFLEKLADRAISENRPGAAQYLNDVTDVKQAILRNVSGVPVWISKMRNDINYKHLHNTWFPRRRSGKISAGVLDIPVGLSSSNIDLSIGSSETSVEEFISICKFLGCLSVEIGDSIASSSTAHGTFGQKWRRFHNHISA